MDRLLARTHRASLYRAALDAEGRRLVLLCSTWERQSLFDSWPQLAVDLLRKLPIDEYRAVLSLHPGVFAAHGSGR